MQLLGSCVDRKVCRSWRSWQSGLPPVCRVQQLARPRRTIVATAAQSTDVRKHQQTVAPAEVSSQIVPQNGTDNSRKLPTVPAPTAGPAKVNVHFEVPEYLTHWGQILKVVGSLEELGDWKVEKAPAMEWHEGHSWTLDVQLPVGAVNFKVVMQEPHGGVRWEQGTDRSVIIPETTSVTGAPVGEVDVTCNFNDVHNSRVEVRPDRNYLKQQLKAVEARVMAIQEKKRKLDQRMSTLTEGLKKYDQTVSLIESGVQDAVTERQRSKEAAAVAQQQQLESQLSAAADSGAAKQQQDINNGNSNSRRGGIMVPIINPEELPSFDDLSYTPADETSSDVDTAEEIAAADALGDTDTDSSSISSSLMSSDDESSAVESQPQQGGLTGGITAIKASHVNETVLSATVDQLLAAAEDALARSSGSSSGDGPGGQGASSSAKMPDNGVNSSQLAEEYVEELLAAASALEQQADQRASLLLEAARQSGDDVTVADIEKLTTVPMPELPSPEQLAEAAAAEAAAAAEVMAAKVDDSSSSSATAAVERVESQSELTVGNDGQPQDPQDEAAVTVSLPAAVDDSSPAGAAADSNPTADPVHAAATAATPQPQPGIAEASTAADKDGTITFSAESLNAEVNTQELLAAVMKRIGIPLEAMSQVTISAKFTPAAETQQQEQPQAWQQAELEQAGFDKQPLGPGTQGQQQQPQRQEEDSQAAQKEPVPDKPKSPVEAIAAAFGAAAAAVTGRRRNDSSSSSGGGAGGSAQAPARSNGRYSKSVPADRETVGNRESFSAKTAATAASGGAHQTGLEFLPHARYRAEEAEKQLAAKEAARRAASEKVAAALAQVEEMRQSVITTNSVLADQLHGSSADGPAAPAGAGSNGTASSSGNFSRYKVSYKDGHKTAAAAAAAPASVNGAGTKVPKGGHAGTGTSSTSSKSGPRSMPTVAAAAVMPQRPPQKQQRGSSAAVEGEVKEELLALAALAASVQSTVDVEHGHQSKRSAEYRDK